MHRRFDDRGDDHIQKLLFTADGRIGRGTFWKGALLSTFAIVAVATALNALLAQFIPNEAAADGEFKADGVTAVPFIILNVATVILLAWTSACLGIKRFHDRGKPGAWVFIMFVPIVGGLWYFVETGFLKGTTGPNAFGPDPLGGPSFASAGFSPAI